MAVYGGGRADMSGQERRPRQGADAFEPFDPSSTDYDGTTRPPTQSYDPRSEPTAYYPTATPAYPPPPTYPPPPMYYAPSYYYPPYAYYRGPPNPTLPMVGGVICIISGTLALMMVGSSFGWPFGIEWMCLSFIVITSSISIVGGVFAIRRTHFTLAVFGAIASVLCSVWLMGIGIFLGVLALILIALGKDAFQTQVAQAPWGWPQP